MPTWWNDSASKMDSVRITSSREPRGLEVQDAAKRAGKVAVPRRLHPAAVEGRPLARERIRDRHHDAAAEELAPFRRDDAERERARSRSSPSFGITFRSEPSA